MHTVYLALGTNLGDRKAIMHEAIERIENKIGTVLRQSSFYETEPWGFESPNRFLNACVCVSTSLAPRQLLETSQEIEREMGRTKKTGNAQYIPHPLMQEREFVMTPLKEIWEE